MRCSHIVNNAHVLRASYAQVQLAAVEYLNISGLVIDFATSPVWTGNSFFDPRPPLGHIVDVMLV